MTFEEFNVAVRKAKQQPRNRIKTVDTRDVIRGVRKRNSKTRVIHEDIYGKVISRIFQLITDHLLFHGHINLQNDFGILSLIELYNNDGEKRLEYYPIDWNKTMELWYKDEKAFEERRLVRLLVKSGCHIKWEHYYRFRNINYYTFVPNRAFLQRIKYLMNNHKPITLLSQ